MFRGRPGRSFSRRARDRGAGDGSRLSRWLIPVDDHLHGAMNTVNQRTELREADDQPPMHRRNHPGRAQLAALLIASLGTIGGPAAQDVDVKVQWRSESVTGSQLAQSLERLYVVLYNTGSLPTRRHRDPDGTAVEAILRQNDLFFGAYFPVGVDAVLCDLNRDVCLRDRRATSEERLDDTATHVGGYEISRGKWSNARGDVLNVPDLAFTRYTSIEQVQVGDAAELMRLLAESPVDCSVYGVSCEEFVTRLNPHLFEAGKAMGKSGTITATIPVSGIQASLYLPADTASDAGTLNRLPDEQKLLKAAPTDQVPATYESNWNTRLESQRPISTGLEALSPNIMSSGGVRLESSHDLAGEPGTISEVAARHEQLLDLIHYPFDAESGLPDDYRAPVSIGVFDTWADTGHCDLGDNIEAVEVTQGGTQRSPAAHCGDMLSTTNVIDDHGTHVVGLIAAMPSNGVGVHGLNPFAKIQFVQIDKSRLRVSDYREYLSNKLVQLYFSKNMKVLNISWRYTNEVGQVDTIRQKIEGLQQNMLIVVAAGNEKADFNTGGCGELPACLTGYGNLITVVGLGRKNGGVELWTADGQGSNTNENFHIAAIAEDVVSTVYGGYTGAMSGTSQAAPQVSAAASLIYAVHENVFRIDEPYLPPQRVKNRLMYTSDIIPSLLDKVKSGRLNVERALDVGRTRIVLKESDGAQRSYIGNLTQFGNDPNNEIVVCRTADSEYLEIKRRDLRRMYYDDARDRYIIFRNARSGDRDSPLDRIVDCTLRTLTHEGVIQTEEGPRRFAFWQIRDYVSPMFD
ncbi:MAG: hypothetical protein DWQ08_15125 [Proteobacteria bacterium]|nr:MAG: hypothetical protein DWQ08_15125 [Pseudomonadota bacterium]